MGRTLKLRSQFLYELELIHRAHPDNQEFSNLDIELIRQQIQFISQKTRFQIFLLLKSHGPMTREEIAEAINFDRKKLYYHLYLMMKINILEPRTFEDISKFVVSEQFLNAALPLFQFD